MKKLNIYGVMLTVSFFLASFFIVVFVNQHIMNKTNNRNYNMFIGHDAAKAMIVCDSPFIISPADLGSDFVIYGML
ncbi:MAG: hypothetical protein J5816_01965, partial [Clostridia bacterium]|nr:hypothetical protein [Clostridia bacterium]